LVSISLRLLLPCNSSWVAPPSTMTIDNEDVKN
jgi:hypothetical protein